MSLSILGIGTVSALGSGVETLRQGLQGKVKPNIEEKVIPASGGEKRLPVYQPIAAGLDRFIPKRALRRVDQFAQIALLSTYLAIEDAGIEFEDKSRVGVVFGSGYGPTRTTFKFLDNIIDDGDIGASPTHFANSVHNALASQASIFLGLTGPCSTVTCFEHTLSNVLLTAKDWLDQDVVDYVLLGLGDEYCDVLGYAAEGMN
ncbi:MAG: beta-ketoacyl synthase chain length factor, partial [Calditrichaceae bacterium]